MLTEGQRLANSCANKILHSFESLYAPIHQYLCAGGERIN